MTPYLLLKLAHIVSGALLFGTGLGIAFFCWFGYRAALRAGDIEGLRSTLRLTVIADACFTAPAVVIQLATGLAIMDELKWPLVSQWSIAVFALYALVGACWLPVVAIQMRLAREAKGAPSVEALPTGFHDKFRLWFRLGVPAFTGVVLIYCLMVWKPLSVLLVQD